MLGIVLSQGLAPDLANARARVVAHLFDLQHEIGERGVVREAVDVLFIRGGLCSYPCRGPDSPLRLCS